MKSDLDTRYEGLIKQVEFLSNEVNEWKIRGENAENKLAATTHAFDIERAEQKKKIEQQDEKSLEILKQFEKERKELKVTPIFFAHVTNN